MNNVIIFSPPLHITSEETQPLGEKIQGEQTFRDDITIEEFQRDLQLLTKMELRKKYETEATSHRLRQNHAKKINRAFEFPIFKDFLEYMKPKRHPGQTLDRINNTQGYISDNMRWADKDTQNNNKSDNILLTVDGVTKTLAQWAHYTEQPYSTLYNRYKKPDWPDDWIVNGKPKGTTTTSAFTKKFATEWATCRPADLSPGRAWPSQQMVRGYEKFLKSRPHYWYGRNRTPVCVWLAAYILKFHNQVRYQAPPPNWDPDYVDPNWQETEVLIDRLVDRFNHVMTLAYYRFMSEGEADDALQVVRWMSRKV